MKTISAFTTTKIDNPYIDIVRVVKIEFSGLTLNLCDRVWGDAGSECVFNGTLYEPLIESWGDIRSGRINPITYEVEPSSADFVVLNGIPVGGSDSFTELFGSYEPHFTTVTISEFHVGASAAEDLEDIFKGNIEDFPEMTTDIVSVTCSGYELSIANKFSHNIVEATTYPQADPDDLGKMLPQVYGRAKKVPFMAVDAGGFTFLIADISASVTTIDITDSAKLDASGTVQISAEQITYTGNTSNQLTGCTRGVNATAATIHARGAYVAQIQSNYIYIIGHAVKAVDVVYVGGARTASGFTAYTGQTGDAHASYPGKACIDFTVLPILARQVDFTLSDTTDVSDTIGVSDTITVVDGIIINDTAGVSDAITVADNIGYTSAGSNKELYPNAYNAGSYPQQVTNPANVYDGNETTYCAIDAQGNPSWTCPSTNYGTIATQYMWILIEIIANETITIQDSDGNTLGTISITPKAWFRFTKSGGTWALGLKVTGIDENSSTRIYEIKKIVEYTPTLTKTGAAYRGGAATATGGVARSGDATKGGAATKEGAATKTGAVTLTGNSIADIVIGGIVACDLQGFQDDGAGTYTGTPNALIERPDHILKHILINRCGLTASEIDSTTYTAAGAYYATNSFVLAFAILEKPNSRFLINEIARQAKSIEIWEAGVHKLIHLPVDETTDKSIDGYRIDLDQIWVKYTDRADIKNTLSARYNRIWSGYTNETESDQGVVIATDTPSVTKYGTLQGDPFSFPYIPGATQAQAILDLTKEDLNNPRLMVEFSGGYYLTDLERGDIIEFANVTVNEGDTPTNLSNALLGLVRMSLHQFRIIDKTQSDSIKLETIRLKPLYQKTIEGQYDILLQKTTTGQYDILLQKLIEGQYDINVQKIIEGKYDILLQTNIESKYDLLLQKLIEGKYKINVGNTVEGKYDILLQKTLEGKYDILLQKTAEGQYDILLQKLIEGKYDIKAPDDWGDSDTWGDSDVWELN